MSGRTREGSGDKHAGRVPCHLRILDDVRDQAMRTMFRIGMVFCALSAVFGSAGSALADSQCFKNRDAP